MSRGLGRWQALLLHELYHNPRPATAFDNASWIRATRYASSHSEDVAIRRAAHGLAQRGLVRMFEYSGGRVAHTLYQLDPAPDVTCPVCGVKCCEQRTAATDCNTYDGEARVSKLDTPDLSPREVA